MVNNYPKYAGAISYQKADESNNRHFYNAEVAVDPSDDSMTAKLTKDGEVISELPDGGGGSSDLSIAKVTFVFSGTKPNIDYPETIYIQPTLDVITYANVITPLGAESVTLDVVCWKNKCVVENITDDSYIGSSGSCEYDSDKGIIYVTGDCTITVYRPGSI